MPFYLEYIENGCTECKKTDECCNIIYYSERVFDPPHGSMWLVLNLLFTHHNLCHDFQFLLTFLSSNLVTLM
jgi:hypothetical protein